MHFFNESFYLAICFFIFIFLIYKTLRKFILNLLDNQINLIKSNLLEAKKLKEEASYTLEQTKREVADLKRLKSEIIDNANIDSHNTIQLLEQKMQEELTLKKEHMLSFIEDKQKKAYDNLYKNLNEQALKLVSEYLTATNNENLKDIEIAKLIKDQYK